MREREWTDDELMREYLDLCKHSLNNVFGGNARRALTVVANQLLARGITEIPNIFGPIKVRA